MNNVFIASMETTIDGEPQRELNRIGSGAATNSHTASAGTIEQTPSGGLAALATQHGIAPEVLATIKAALLTDVGIGRSAAEYNLTEEAFQQRSASASRQSGATARSPNEPPGGAAAQTEIESTIAPAENFIRAHRRGAKSDPPFGGRFADFPGMENPGRNKPTIPFEIDEYKKRRDQFRTLWNASYHNDREDLARLGLKAPLSLNLVVDYYAAAMAQFNYVPQRVLRDIFNMRELIQERQRPLIKRLWSALRFELGI